MTGKKITAADPHSLPSPESAAGIRPACFPTDIGYDAGMIDRTTYFRKTFNFCHFNFLILDLFRISDFGFDQPILPRPIGGTKRRRVR
jgi:hypothetical protein